MSKLDIIYWLPAMVEKDLVLLQLLLQFSLPLLKLFLAESVEKAYIRDW